MEIKVKTVKELWAWRDKWAPGATLVSKDEVRYEIFKKKGVGDSDGQPIILRLASKMAR